MCQFIGEEQLGKVQQQVICSAGTESPFTLQFRSVILTPLAIRCVYMVSVTLCAEVACMHGSSELEKSGGWAFCTEASLLEPFIV